MTKRILAILAALALSISQAFAGAGTITVLDSTGATQTYKVITDGSSHFVGTFGLCDGVAAAQCVAIKAASTAAIATDPSLVVTISPNTVAMPTSVTSWGGGTLGAMANYGTSPGAVLVPGVNAFITNTNANVEWNADGVANTTLGSPTTSLLMAFNGSTVDRLEDDANKSLKVAAQASPAGGASTTGAIAPNNTTAVVLKASAGTLYGAQLAGLGSTPAYLKFYNATSATCGSGTPVKRLMIPAAATAANGAGSNITFGPQGVAFSTGITYCITTGITDADTTAAAASTFLVNVDWN